MTFSIHQPNYIPWLGYFYKIYCSDIFIYLDSVQYPRGQSFAARNQVNTPNGKLFLTIPVSIEKGKEGKVTYMDVNYSDPKWRSKHLRTLEANYKKSPYYPEVLPLFQSVLVQDLGFVDNNIQIIENICNYLGIHTKRTRLSSLPDVHGNKTGLITSIGKQLDADVYLSGDGGGTEYTDEKTLVENNIKLAFTGFHHPEYKQLWTDSFISHLSILDLLFNEGNNSLNIILNSNNKIPGE